MRASGNRAVRQAEKSVTVGFHAPLPPAPTGVADYAAALLGALRQLGPVEVASERCDVHLFHFGNNPLHAGIYRRALERPGVIVLHDAVLHHFLLGQLDQPRYIEEFVYNYGAWNRQLAADLWSNRSAAASDNRYFQFPMLKRVCERARAVVVHNPAAARMVKEHAPQAPVIEIPHLFQPPEPLPEPEVARYRQRLGLPSDAFVFGVFGYLRESKRLAGVLQTFAQLRRENPRAALVIAGSFISTDLERAVEPLLAEPGVLRLPHLSERDFWLTAAAVDACINLRDPAAGETSGIAIRLMGIGKPVLLTGSEENLRFPLDACIRIPPGVAERDSLWRHMVLLLSVPELAGTIGSRAADHIRVHHALDQVAHRYWDTLCEHRS